MSMDQRHVLYKRTLNFTEGPIYFIGIITNKKYMEIITRIFRIKT